MRTLTLFMAALVSVLGLSFAAQADPTIDLLFSGAPSTTASASDTITVDVVLTLAGGDQTDGYQLTIFFDTAELSYTTGSGNFSNVGPPGAVTSGFGEYFYTGSSLPGVMSAIMSPATGAGTYTIGSVTFTVTNPVNDGNADITVGYHPPSFYPADFISSVGGNYASPTFNGAGVNVIPEPTTASLLGLGLLGLTVAGRRRR